MNGNFGGGDGSYYNPYLVEDALDLNVGVRNKATSSTSYRFKQVKDIDMSTISKELKNGFYGYSPINLYKNSYAGGGYKIKNLYIEDDINNPNSSHIGLFSECENIGDVEYLHLVDVNIISHGEGYDSVAGFKAVGALIGYAKDNYGDIVGCSVTGSIKVDKQSMSGSEKVYVGGLIGYSDRYIQDSSFDGMIEANGNVGGLAGYAYKMNLGKGKGTLKVGHYSEGCCVGGVVGTGGGVMCSEFIGEIDADCDYCGGIEGSGSVSQSVVQAKITGNIKQCGGIIAVGPSSECAGYITINSISEKIGGINVIGSVTNCYALGSIVSSSECIVKSLTADDLSIIKTSYSAVMINNNIASIDNIAGGSGDGFIFYDKDIATDSTRSRYGRTEIQLRDIETYKESSEYSKLWTTGDYVGLGKDGDVALTGSGQIVYGYSPGDVIGEVYRTKTRINGVWATTVHRKMIGPSWKGDFGKSGEVSNPGDIYSYRNNTTGNYEYYVYNLGEYRLAYVSSTWLDYVYRRVILYEDIPNKTMENFVYEGIDYMFYEEAPALVPYDFVYIWGIAPDMNYGFPYLRNIDYSDIVFSGVANYINVTARGLTKKIPLYDGEAGSNKAYAKLVDITDSKASQVRVVVNGVIKSWSI